MRNKNYNYIDIGKNEKGEYTLSMGNLFLNEDRTKVIPDEEGYTKKVVVLCTEKLREKQASEKPRIALKEEDLQNLSNAIAKQGVYPTDSNKKKHVIPDVPKEKLSRMNEGYLPDSDNNFDLLFYEVIGGTIGVIIGSLLMYIWLY